MLGRKEKCFKEFLVLSLEGLVPPNHFYRQLEAKLDLRFVQDLVKASYSRTMGRPSIDPIVFFQAAADHVLRRHPLGTTVDGDREPQSRASLVPRL